jgi:hypothetical protein
LISDEENALPTAKIAVDNASRVLVDMVRTPTTPPVVQYSIVLASDPNTVEVGPIRLYLADVTITTASITGTLIPKPVFNKPFPPDRVTPSIAPGVFKV